jgi:hypothetical protein
VVENADNCVHITMPAAPGGHHELSDQELHAAAGGVTVTDYWCRATGCQENSSN